jgi:hypothetical protein
MLVINRKIIKEEREEISLKIKAENCKLSFTKDSFIIVSKEDLVLFATWLLLSVETGDTDNTDCLCPECVLLEGIIV